MRTTPKNKGDEFIYRCDGVGVEERLRFERMFPGTGRIPTEWRFTIIAEHPAVNGACRDLDGMQLRYLTPISAEAAA